MDRFIGRKKQAISAVAVNLKSNMDRFIETSSEQLLAESYEFKIQYG